MKTIEILIEDQADGTKRVRAIEVNKRRIIGEWWVSPAMPELTITVTPDRTDCKVSDAPPRSDRGG